MNRVQAAHPTRMAQSIAVARTTMVLILTTDGVLFGTLLMAYLYLRTAADTIPFAGEPQIHLLLPILNTGILLLSLAAAWRALSIARRDDVGSSNWLMIVLLLGSVFVVGQIVEFARSGMQPNDSLFGGAFFALIGFHALHVVAGIVLLAFTAIRARVGDFKNGNIAVVESAVWFWSFVVGVWLILFAALYLV